jgi:hypothetical protein
VSTEPDNQPAGEDADDVEILDGLPVAAGPPPPVPATLRAAPLPAVQAAALAATGFVAGAATVAVVARRRSRVTRRRRRKGKGALGEIVGSNSFLVDVHLIRRD